MDERQAAKSKRELDEDAPTFEPMSVRVPPITRRAPTTDQKKIRRRWQRDAQQIRTASEGRASMTTENTGNREAELLQAMAAAGTLTEQQRLAAELEELRAARRQEIRAAAAVDLTTGMVESRYPSRPYVHERTSMGSDFLMDIPEEHHDLDQVGLRMATEASVWFNSRPDYVIEDPAELKVQARHKAAYEAAFFGDDAAVAERAFLDRVEHLAGISTGDDDLTVPDGNGSNLPQRVEPGDTFDTINPVPPANPVPESVEHTSPSDSPSLSEGDTPEGEQTPGKDNEQAIGEHAVSSKQPELGAKRRAAQRIEGGSNKKCHACGETIVKADGGGWRHTKYEAGNGYKRNHAAKPKIAAHLAAIDPSQVPPGTEVCPDCGGTGMVPAAGFEDPSQVQNGYVPCEMCKGQGIVPEGSSEAAGFPAPAPTGSPSGAPSAMACLYDVRTDERIAAASPVHERAAARSGGLLWLDGDLDVLASDMLSDPRIVGPVRQAYLGIEN